MALTVGEVITRTLLYYTNVGQQSIEYDSNKRAQAWAYLTEMTKLSWILAPGWWRQQSGGTVSLVNGDLFGVMPADFASFDEQGQAYLSGSFFPPLVWISPDQMFYQRATAPSTGRPRQYTLHGRTVAGRTNIHVYPTAGASYTINVTGYTKKVPDMIDRPGAPTAAAGAAGLLTGVYRWGVTFVTSTGETELSPVYPSNTTVGLTLTTQMANLTAIPISPCRSVTSRKVYRTVAGGAVFKLSGTIADNSTTTYTDNIADGSLGVTAPDASTATGTGIEQFPDDMVESVFIKGLTQPLGRSQGDGRELKWREEWEADIKRFWGEFQQGQNQPLVLPRFGVVKGIGSGYMDPRFYFGS